MCSVLGEHIRLDLLTDYWYRGVPNLSPPGLRFGQGVAGLSLALGGPGFGTSEVWHSGVEEVAADADRPSADLAVVVGTHLTSSLLATKQGGSPCFGLTVSSLDPSKSASVLRYDTCCEHV